MGVKALKSMVYPRPPLPSAGLHTTGGGPNTDRLSTSAVLRTAAGVTATAAAFSTARSTLTSYHNVSSDGSAGGDYGGGGKPSSDESGAEGHGYSS